MTLARVVSIKHLPIFEAEVTRPLLITHAKPIIAYHRPMKLRQALLKKRRTLSGRVASAPRECISKIIVKAV